MNPNIRPRLFVLLAMLTLACGMIAHGQPALPIVTHKARPASIALSPKQSSIRIVKTSLVVSNPVQVMLFTNIQHLHYTTNAPAAWMELMFYTDDSGMNWHFKTPQVFTPADETVTDTNAPMARWYLLTYAPGIKPVNYPATTP